MNRIRHHHSSTRRVNVSQTGKYPVGGGVSGCAAIMVGAGFTIAAGFMCWGIYAAIVLVIHKL